MSAPPPSVPEPPLHFALQLYGRYVLIDRLGAGGMAEVFRALVVGPEQFQRTVVVKRILPHLSANENFVRMFIAEATLCGRLSHPNIVHVHEFGKQDGAYFIAMEYVQGRTVGAILKRLGHMGEQMPVTAAAELARQTCHGLAYAHALAGPDGKPLAIIHRDVTPGNVIVAFNGGVKILDFGIARVAGEARAATTDAGQVKGKSAYIAPEQLRQGTIDGRVDIFATGIVLHEMLTGRRLFKGSSPIETMKLITEMPISAPSKHNALVPPRLDEIVMRALRRDPRERYQTAAEMADDLEAFLHEQRRGAQELAKLVARLFGDELAAETLPSREELDAVIADGGPGAYDQVSVTTELSGGRRIAGETPLPVTNGRRARLRFAAGVVGVAGALATVVWLTARESGTPAAVSAPVAAAPVAAAPVAAPSPPARPADVRISISSTPAGATISRGDDAVGTTPVVLTLPRGTDAIALRVEKPGHVPAQLLVVPDSDQPAVVTLAREAERTAPSRPTARVRKPNEGKVRNAVPIDPFAR